MKIGFWGNMNNYPFMIAKCMKEKGYDVLFIVSETEKLCRPEYRYQEVPYPYPEWIKEVLDVDLDFFKSFEHSDNFNKIINELNTCDYVFLNGYAIRFAKYLTSKHFCILTGSDLTILANYNYTDGMYQKKVNNLIQSEKSKGSFFAIKLIDNNYIFNFFYFLFSIFKIKYAPSLQWFVPHNFFHTLFFLMRYKIALKQLVNQQRQSIKNAIGFIYGPKGAILDGDRILSEIGVQENRRLLGLMIDNSLSHYTSPIKKNKIRIFNVARFNWVNGKSVAHFSQIDMKANDIMIKGIAKFYKKHNTSLDLVFVEKGNDIAETKELIKKLKIEHLVTWKKVLTQKEVQEEYKLADIVFDQLGNSVVTMGGLEAMGVGRPLIANARSEIYDKILGQKTEICNAKSADDVLAWLEKLILDETFRINKGKCSYEFVQKHFSVNSVVGHIERRIK